VCDSFSAGKSTLLNALLGDHLSPTSSQRETACPVKFVIHEKGTTGNKTNGKRKADEIEQEDNCNLVELFGDENRTTEEIHEDIRQANERDRDSETLEDMKEIHTTLDNFLGEIRDDT
jgi:hypothetical protein